MFVWIQSAKHVKANRDDNNTKKTDNESWRKEKKVSNSISENENIDRNVKDTRMIHDVVLVANENAEQA